MNKSFFDFPETVKKNIPNSVISIIKKLEEFGFSAFMVGGCVRDIICRKPVKDWDIVTDARLEQIQNIFYDWKVLYIGKSFQTATLIKNSKAYHISEARCKKGAREASLFKKKGRHSLIIKDLLCRDFSINSIAWNPNIGFLDPANGFRDIKEKVIRSLSPDICFQEDPLRMLRAVRFVCELKFSINKQTGSSIMKHAVLVSHVSPERIREEICLIFKSSNAKKGVLLLRYYDLEKYIYNMDKIKKIFKNTRKDKIALQAINNLREDLSSQLALWGRLSFSTYQHTQNFFIPLICNLKFKKETINKLKILLSKEWEKMSFNSDKDVRYYMLELGKENTKTMFYLKKIMLSLEQNSTKLKTIVKEERLLKNELQLDRPVSLDRLAIKGEDLIKMGIPEGRRIGEILQLLLNKIVISPESNNKEYLINIIKNIIKSSDLQNKHF